MAEHDVHNVKYLSREADTAFKAKRRGKQLLDGHGQPMPSATGQKNRMGDDSYQSPNFIRCSQFLYLCRLYYETLC